MKKIIFFSSVFILAIVLMLNSSGSSNVKQDGPGFDTDIIEINKNIHQNGQNFSKWLRENTNLNIVPSVTAGIVYKDMLVFSDSVNSTTDSRFSIASLTKTFTAIVILQLAEEGLLKLTDPVKNHLKGFQVQKYNDNEQPITIMHLLSHTSGVSNCRQIFPAGTRYMYSNWGFIILKKVIESVTGKSYAQELKNRIFLPLEMDSSTGEHSNGTGGILTTLKDLANYTSMLIQKGKFKDRLILTERTFNNMLLPVLKIPGRSNNYYISLSWEVTSVDDKVVSFYKAGRWFGSASVLQVFPNKNMALIFLCNPPNHQSGAFLSWRYNITGKLISLLRKLSPVPEYLAVNYFLNNNLQFYTGANLYNNTALLSDNVRNIKIFSETNSSDSNSTILNTENFLIGSTGRLPINLSR